MGRVWCRFIYKNDINYMTGPYLDCINVCFSIFLAIFYFVFVGLNLLLECL